MTDLALQGRLDEAIPCFERALQLNPEFAASHYNLAVALSAQGKLDEAIYQCQLAIRLKPDYAEAHHRLGVALATQGKWNEATQHLEQALGLALSQGKSALAETIRARPPTAQTVPPMQMP